MFFYIYVTDFKQTLYIKRHNGKNNTMSILFCLFSKSLYDDKI